MISNLSLILKKYTVPVLFFVVGCVMLYIAIATEQSLVFIVASLMMLIAGILSIGFSTGNIKSGLVYVLGIIAGIGGLVAIALSYTSVKTTLTYQNNAKECAAIATQNLQDIRYIQKSYKEKTGKYIGDWDEFVEFANNGTVPFLDQVGAVPSRKIDEIENKYLYSNNPVIDFDMTEEEAYKLSLWTEGPNWGKDFKNFKRDTIPKSLMDVKFGTKAYKANRKKLGFYTFSADSLPVIPHTSVRWSLETKDSVKNGDESFPTIRVEGRIPYGTKKQGLMYFGSISLNELGGSWEE